MANTFITPSVIAKVGLAKLYNTIVLAGLVNRDYDDDFAGKVGDTITIKSPASFTAQVFNRNSGIQLQDATEGSTTATLDTLLDVSFAVTAEELSLKITDFQKQLLDPAMEALAQDIDGRLAEALVDAAERAGGGGTASQGAGTPSSTIRTARAILGRNKLPMENRYAVLSPEAAAKMLGEDLLVRADASGSTAALRDALIGRVHGFGTYETQTLGYGPNDKGQADGIAFHRDAVALISRTLPAPEGVAPSQVAIANYKGLGLRVVKAYDINKKQDVVSIDTLIGVKELRKEAAVQLDLSIGS